MIIIIFICIYIMVIWILLINATPNTGSSRQNNFHPVHRLSQDLYTSFALQRHKLSTSKLVIISTLQFAGEISVSYRKLR